MAFDFSKLNFFSRLDARARMLVLFGAVLGVIGVIYLLSAYFGSSQNTVGPSDVAGAPGDLVSVPGRELTSEYSRALRQANENAAKKAQITGNSAVPTLMNFGDAEGSTNSGTDCNIICTDKAENIKYSLDEWVKKGTVSPEVAVLLKQLANKNVPVSEFEVQLAKLVKENKLTPEQARELLDRYKKQYANKLLEDSATSMDKLIKSGDLPLAVANELLADQKAKMPLYEYKAVIDKMVADGKITPEVARQLVAQYTDQTNKEAANNRVAHIQELARNGKLTPEAQNALVQLEQSAPSLDDYTKKVQQLVKDGTLSPEIADQLIKTYRDQKINSLTSSLSNDQRISQAEQNARDNLGDAVKAGKMTQDTANQLNDLMRKNVTKEEYQQALQKLVNDGKISADTAKAQMDQYNNLKDIRDNGNTSNNAAQLNKAENDMQNNLNDAVKNGKMSQDTAAQLSDLAKNNVSKDAYQQALQKLVNDGKISADTAKAQMDQYNNLKDMRDANNNGNTSTNAAQLNKAENDMQNNLNDAVKNGKMSQDTATQLSDLSKNNVSKEAYQQALQKLVNEGKISADTAKAQMDQYGALKDLRDNNTSANTAANSAQVKNAEDNIQNSLNDAVKAGKISQSTANELSDLVKKNVSADEYKAALQRLVAEGKLPAQMAETRMKEYQALKTLRDTPDALQMIRKTEEQTYRGIDNLVTSGKISKETGQTLSDLVQKNVSLPEMQDQLNQMVKAGKIAPDVAAAVMQQYKKVHDMRDMRNNLLTLQAKNAPLDAYQQELKKWVAAGVITPAQATQLLNDYKQAKAAIAANAAVTTSGTGVAATEGFARLQAIANSQREGEGGAPVGATSNENWAQNVVAPAFNQSQATTDDIQKQAASQDAELQAERQAQEAAVSNLVGAMSGQAAGFIASWAPPTMSHTGGGDGAGKSPGATSVDRTTTTTTTSSSGNHASDAPPIIKAGTILFAVLDTTVNSDYPDSPVMATIVEGPLKNAKLLGKLVTTKSVSGQLDRISLNFTMMTSEDWPKSKSITVYAIDPDTARTALASHVDYHYMQRFGAMMATSFLTGYGNSITQAGTSTTGIFGTSTTHPALSPSQKLFTALGQMGTTLGAATQNYINIPPTVKVDAGAGLGLLFMSDVAA